jgi:hypothetical protein
VLTGGSEVVFFDEARYGIPPADMIAKRRVLFFIALA